ncbi:MAG: TolC family protein [Desulfopila sp.]
MAYVPSSYRTCHLGLVIFLLVCLSSCVSISPYSYDSIKKEYNGRPSPLSVNQEYGKIADENLQLHSGMQFPLTLQNAIDVSMRNNPDLIGAAWRIQRSKAILQLADTGFWPQVAFYTEYMQGDAPSAYLFKNIDQRRLPQKVDFNDPGWFENFESGFKGQINLFNGGSDYLSILMARQDKEISELDRNRIANDLTSQVIHAFYDALAAEDFIEIAEESITTVEEQLRIMTVRYKGGAVNKSDLLSLEVRLAQAREQLVAGRNRFQLACAALANLMGLEPSTLAEKGGGLAASATVVPGVPETYGQGVIVAVNRRPELAQVRKQLIRSRMALDSAKTAYLPRLDLMAKYYMNDRGLDYDTSRDNWTTALLLQWDLFTGFSRGAQVSQAEAIVLELLAADHEATLVIKLDVKTAYLNLEEAGIRYQVARSSVDSAEESFRLVREHYQGGAVTVNRYLKAELDWNRSRTRATAAQYDKIKALAEVARSIGVWAVQPLAGRHN